MKHGRPATIDYDLVESKLKTRFETTRKFWKIETSKDLSLHDDYSKPYTKVLKSNVLQMCKKNSINFLLVCMTCPSSMPICTSQMCVIWVVLSPYEPAKQKPAVFQLWLQMGMAIPPSENPKLLVLNKTSIKTHFWIQIDLDPCM